MRGKESVGSAGRRGAEAVRRECKKKGREMDRRAREGKTGCKRLEKQRGE